MTVTECNDYGPHEHRKKPGRVPLTKAGNALLRNPPGPFTGQITRADIAEIERQAVERYVRESSAPDVEGQPHPGVSHEFRTTCRICGEPGYLNVAVVTPSEVVRIEDRDSRS